MLPGRTWTDSPSFFLSTSASSPHLTSEAAQAAAHDSDAEGDNHRTSTFRLHEGVSHPSRADNVDDLHRLQKSVTKARHDGRSEMRERTWTGLVRPRLSSLTSSLTRLLSHR